ncbi:hypothetical protein OF83DRAFT_877644 [Amylostereum chailletii]|nr:hypothetical protein OF83DRAFT_877644 [Amylostereum chailletii]
MAAVVLSSPAVLPQSGHFLAHPAPTTPNSRVHFSPAPAHFNHPRQGHNNANHAFNAFDMHHHPHHQHGPSPAMTSSSWRAHAHAPESTKPRSSSPKRAGGRTHSRAPSTASESSNASWRSRSTSRETKTSARPTPSGKHVSAFFVPFLPDPDCSPIVAAPSSPSARTPPRAIPFYTPAELLRLASSPNVGITAEARASLEDFVAHWVWRRGPHTGPSSQRHRGHKRVSSSASASSHASHGSDSDGSGSI